MSFIPDIWTASIQESMQKQTALFAVMPRPRITRWQRIKWRTYNATWGRVHNWIHRNCSDY